MEHRAWGPSETPVYGREPVGLFHGGGMGMNVWVYGAEGME